MTAAQMDERRSPVGSPEQRNSDANPAGSYPYREEPCNEVRSERMVVGSDSGLSLLELAANNDLAGFKLTVETEGAQVDEVGTWYSRPPGVQKLTPERRTPAMVAALNGSVDVLSYILSFFRAMGADINRRCGADGATALHCAVAGGSSRAAETVALLLRCGADREVIDNLGRRPADVDSNLPPHVKAAIDQLLKSPYNDLPSPCGKSPRDPPGHTALYGPGLVEANRAKYGGGDFAQDPSLPDVKSSAYATDEFRMYSFKVRPCSRAYSHDWTECPFVHPGENARRRDPRRYHYSCVPCPDFRKGACRRGDSCEYAHGVFECWLHPAQYRTRLCKDGLSCMRRVCFFAHRQDELRPVNATWGMTALPSPRALSLGDMRSLSPPLARQSPQSVLMTPPFSPPTSGTPPHSPNGGKAAPPPSQGGHVPTLMLPGSHSRLRSFSTGDQPHNGDVEQLGGEFGGLGAGLNKPPLSNTPTPRFGKPYALQIEDGGLRGGVVPRPWGFSSPRVVSEHPPQLPPWVSPRGGPVGGMAGWGSPTGKPDWGVKAEDMQKVARYRAQSAEPDISWVQSLVRDEPLVGN